jgi:hypothetical protein
MLTFEEKLAVVESFRNYKEKMSHWDELTFII